MASACSAGEDMSEATLVANNALWSDGEVALAVEDFLSALGQSEDRNMSAVHGSHTVEKAHTAEGSDYLLLLDKVDEAVGQVILNDQTYLPDGLSDYGLPHAKMAGDVAKTSVDGQFHDGKCHSLLLSERWLRTDILACDMGDHPGEDVHEGGLAHTEGLDPLFIIPDVQDDPLPPVVPGATGSEQVSDGLEVMPQHPFIHVVLSGLTLIRYLSQ